MSLEIKGLICTEVSSSVRSQGGTDGMGPALQTQASPYLTPLCRNWRGNSEQHNLQANHRPLPTEGRTVLCQKQLLSCKPAALGLALPCRFCTCPHVPPAGKGPRSSMESQGPGRHVFTIRFLPCFSCLGEKLLKGSSCSAQSMQRSSESHSLHSNADPALTGPKQTEPQLKGMT